MEQINPGDLTKLQNDAMKRVYDMQRKAKQTFEAAQTPLSKETVPVNNVPADKTYNPGRDGARELFLNLSDPVMRAALAYLFGR